LLYLHLVLGVFEALLASHVRTTLWVVYSDVNGQALGEVAMWDQSLRIDIHTKGTAAGRHTPFHCLLHEGILGPDSFCALFHEGQLGQVVPREVGSREATYRRADGNVGAKTIDVMLGTDAHIALDGGKALQVQPQAKANALNEVAWLHARGRVTWDGSEPGTTARSGEFEEPERCGIVVRHIAA
jgi:hypothetical protein